MHVLVLFGFFFLSFFNVKAKIKLEGDCYKI